MTDTKDQRLEAQKAEIQRVAEALNISVEELADRIVLQRETMRKYAKGYQPASKRIMSTITNLAPPRHVMTGGPRGLLQEALRKRGWAPADLAKQIKYDAGVTNAIVMLGGRISENMAVEIVKVIPELTLEELVGGSDLPRILEESGVRGTMGAIPKVISLDGQRVRMIPLISMTQAGPSINFDDEIYQHEAVAVVDVKDPRAFALQVRGNSMEPEIKDGDVAVVCPSWTPRNGDEVICRTVHGDVMCKIYQTKFNGQFIILSSYNPAYPAVELQREEIEWIYPVQSVQKTRRRE